MKTEVYSWRVSAELKSGLEREARRRKTSIGTVLDLAARDWLAKSEQETGGEAAQQRLHEAAARCIGSIESGNGRGSTTVRETVKERLQRRYGR